MQVMLGFPGEWTIPGAGDDSNPKAGGITGKGERIGI